MNKILSTVAVLVLVLGIGLWIGHSLNVLLANFGSPVGTTFNNAKIAAVNMSPLLIAATSSSILNSDASDRWITDSGVACTGVGTSNTITTGTGLASWTFQAATTSVASLGLQGNTNYAANITVATSSAYVQTASSTPGVIGAISALWKAGSYMTFTYNATNTAACTPYVHYIAS